MAKPVSFLGNSLDRIKEFPQGARREAGFQLDKVQHGLMPDDWKPMQTIGKGVSEIRIRDSAGAYRVVYIASFPEAVTCCTPSRKSGRLPPRPTWISPVPDWKH